MTDNTDIDLSELLLDIGDEEEFVQKMNAFFKLFEEEVNSIRADFSDLIKKHEEVKEMHKTVLDLKEYFDLIDPRLKQAAEDAKEVTDNTYKAAASASKALTAAIATVEQTDIAISAARIAVRAAKGSDETLPEDYEYTALMDAIEYPDLAYIGMV